MKISKEALETLRSKLPKGSLSKIAEKAGCSIPFVSRVLTGEKKSEQVINAAMEVAEEDKKRKEAIEKQIEQI